MTETPTKEFIGECRSLREVSSTRSVLQMTPIRQPDIADSGMVLPFDRPSGESLDEVFLTDKKREQERHHDDY